MYHLLCTYSNTNPPGLMFTNRKRDGTLCVRTDCGGDAMWRDAPCNTPPLYKTLYTTLFANPFSRLWTCLFFNHLFFLHLIYNVYCHMLYYSKYTNWTELITYLKIHKHFFVCLVSIEIMGLKLSICVKKIVSLVMFNVHCFLGNVQLYKRHYDILVVKLSWDLCISTNVYQICFNM